MFDDAAKHLLAKPYQSLAPSLGALYRQRSLVLFSQLCQRPTNVNLSIQHVTPPTGTLV